jgi:hypothetical protein
MDYSVYMAALITAQIVGAILLLLVFFVWRLPEEKAMVG